MTGSIFKRPLKNGRTSWGYIIDDGVDAAGKRYQTTKAGFATKREVADALRDALSEAGVKSKAKAAPAPPSVPTFSVFFERWMAEHTRRKCQPKTIERYSDFGSYAMRQTVEIAGEQLLFGDVTIDKFGPMQLELLINALLDHGGQKTKDFPGGKALSARSVRHIACAIHGCFEKAVTWRLIPINPMNGVDLPKFRRAEPKIVEKDGVGKLLERARNTRVYPLILLGLATACRRGEMLALLWSDINFESGLMQVSKSLEQTKKGLRVKSTKSEKPRKFIVPAQALEALIEHRAQQDGDKVQFGAAYEDNGLVFCQPEGGYYSPDRVGARVSELMKKAGLEGVSLHSLRHTHASELISAGVPITAIAKRLGHANANVTLSIYSHALEADEVAAAKIWEDAMAGVIIANKLQLKAPEAAATDAGPGLQLVGKVG
jgi:integrase